LLPTTPWLSSSVRLGTAEPNGSIKGVIHSLTPATEVRPSPLPQHFAWFDPISLQLLSNEGSQEGMLPVFASTAACDLLLKVMNIFKWHLFGFLLHFQWFITPVGCELLRYELYLRSCFSF
jgi:hypothetical protein